MDPEEQARLKIDKMLTDSGWTIQDYGELNLGAGLGIAVREFPLGKDSADYVLFIDRQPIGVVEAKKVGWTLRGVTEQSEKYLDGLAEKFPNAARKPQYSYETTGIETLFADRRDPKYRSRYVFTFHRPEILADWLKEEKSLRARLKTIPELNYPNLRDCQSHAIINLEKSFSDNKPRALIQMATGTGKTFVAVTSIYRLLKFAKANRVLFLVDRANLGRQALREFQQYETPDDGRKFTELYTVQHLQSQTIDDVSVVISTIQRLFSILKGKKEFNDEDEELSEFETKPDETPVDIEYNSNIPIGEFDFIVIDECHRSIYNKWKQVLDYFDAFLIGLTATPSKHTVGFFNNNQVMAYTHERAVADGVNVGYHVYKIRTKITSTGSTIEAGETIEKRDRMTREQRAEKLDEDFTYDQKQLDRDVVAPDQIRLILKTFKEKLPEIFPGRTHVPKTLIFAKDDAHAEEITKIIREVFGEGNEFCKKITYRMSRLDNQLDDKGKEEITEASGGQTIRHIINKVLDGIDSDKQIERAKEKFQTKEPTKEQIAEVAKESVAEACSIFDSAKLRKIIIDVKKRNEMIIDSISIDELEEAGFDEQAKALTAQTVESFKEFLEKNRDELTALNIIYSKPYKMREITFKDIKDLANAIEKPPYNLTPELLWSAYQRLDKSKVKENPAKMLTDLISIVRYSIGKDDLLMPFDKVVDERLHPAFGV